MYEATTRNSPPTDQSVDYSCCRLCKNQGLPFFGLFLFLFRLAASSCVPILLILLGSAAPSYISLPEPAYALPPSALQPLPLVLHQFLEPLRTGLSSQPCPNFLSTPGVVRLGQKVGPGRVQRPPYRHAVEKGGVGWLVALFAFACAGRRVFVSSLPGHRR